MLEIEVQGARQVREALPEAVQVFIAPPSATRCARGWWAVARTSPSRSSAGLRARGRSWRRADEFEHVIVNDELERSARGGARASSSLRIGVATPEGATE